MSLRHFAWVCVVAVGCSSPSPKEMCTNGLDDDGNGKIDCDDSACVGQPLCVTDAGYWGNCSKCGQSCSKQSECFGTNVLDDRPIAQCGMSKCQLFNESVQVKMRFDTGSWAAVSSGILGAVATRWISKKGLDGSDVTCAAVTAAASSVSQPLQLEMNGKFAMLGLDVTRVMLTGATVPNPLTIPFAYVGTGSDYLIFVEAWSGGVDPSTHLPNGTRRSPTTCVESGAEVAPLSKADDCSADAGSCRVFNLTLPRPM